MKIALFKTFAALLVFAAFPIGFVCAGLQAGFNIGYERFANSVLRIAGGK